MASTQRPRNGYLFQRKRNTKFVKPGRQSLQGSRYTALGKMLQSMEKSAAFSSSFSSFDKHGESSSVHKHKGSKKWLKTWLMAKYRFFYYCIQLLIAGILTVCKMCCTWLDPKVGSNSRPEDGQAQDDEKTRDENTINELIVEKEKCSNLKQLIRELEPRTSSLSGNWEEYYAKRLEILDDDEDVIQKEIAANMKLVEDQRKRTREDMAIAKNREKVQNALNALATPLREPLPRAAGEVFKENGMEMAAFENGQREKDQFTPKKMPMVSENLELVVDDKKVSREGRRFSLENTDTDINQLLKLKLQEVDNNLFNFKEEVKRDIQKGKEDGGENRIHIHTLRQDVGTIRETIDELIVDKGVKHEEMDELRQDVGTIRETIDLLKKEVSQLKHCLKSIKEESEGKDEKIAQLEEQVTELKKGMENKDLEIAVLKEKTSDVVSGMKENLETEDEGITQLKEPVDGQWASVNEDTTGIISRDEFLQLKWKVGVHSGEITQLKEDFAAKFAELKENIEAKNVEIAQLKGDMDENDRGMIQLKDDMEERDMEIEQMSAAIGANWNEIAQFNGIMHRFQLSLAIQDIKLRIQSDTLMMVERRLYLDTPGLFRMICDLRTDLNLERENMDRALQDVWHLKVGMCGSRQRQKQRRRHSFNACLKISGQLASGELRKLDICLQECIQCPYFDRRDCVYLPDVTGPYHLTVFICQRGLGRLEARLVGDDDLNRFMGASTSNAQGEASGLSQILTLTHGRRYWIEVRQLEGEAQLECCLFSGHVIG